MQLGADAEGKSRPGKKKAAPEGAAFTVARRRVLGTQEQ
jgi:hypothetical protein